MPSDPYCAIVRSQRIVHPRQLAGAIRTRCCLCGLLFLLALILVGLSGCKTLQSRSSQRSSQCDALCAQARAARDAGNPERANEFLNEALRQQPSDLETRRRLAETMWTNGRHSEAISQFISLREEYPDDSRLAARLAILQWESNQHVAASRSAVEALRLDPHSKDAWLIKARGQVEQGELDAALSSYLRLSQEAPDNFTTLVELGELHLKRGQADRACPLFRTAMMHPQATVQQKIETEWLLGVAYAKSERWSEAIEVMDRLILVRDSTADDWCFLGWTRMHGGDWAGAESALMRAEQAEPDSVAVRRFSRQLKSTSSPNRQVSSVEESDDPPARK